tara:strand:- start:4590 stop:4841 length:252 start_codon:yes stop_codon:yes gene_type:complete
MAKQLISSSFIGGIRVECHSLNLLLPERGSIKMEAYKIYIDGLLWGAFYQEAKWKAVIHELEDNLQVECNAVNSPLQTNVKHK